MLPDNTRPTPGPDKVVPMAKRSKTYIWQFVIGLGFLSGVWTAIGIDPEAVLLGVLGTAVTALWPDPNIRLAFILLPMLLLVVSVYGAYRGGKVFGLISVVLAYLAGLSVPVSLATTLILLVIALFAAYLATNRRLVRKFTGR
jgi:hypothetical protein